MIYIKNLSKHYEHVKVLENLDLELPQTGIYAVSGKSGVGKSTFFNILSGLDSMSSGTVCIDGYALHKMTQNELDAFRSDYIALIFQDYALLDNLTVYENVWLSSMYEADEKETKKKIEDLLISLKLIHYKDKQVLYLSGGEKQKVAIARALIKNPKIILADEPTGSLDKENAHQIMDILKKISKEKLVIVISHNDELIKHYADKVLTLKNGNFNENVEKSEFVEKSIKSKSVAFRFIKRFTQSSIRSKRLQFIFLALVLAFSMVSLGLSILINRSVDNYVTHNYERLIHAYPIEISQTTLYVPELSHQKVEYPYRPDYLYAIPDNIVEQNLKVNHLTEDYYDYVLSMDESYYQSLRLLYGETFNYALKTNNVYEKLNIKTHILYKDTTQVANEFEVIYEKELDVDYNFVLIVDAYNRIPKDLALYLKLDVSKPISFLELTQKVFYHVDNQALYQKNNNTYEIKPYHLIDSNLKSIGISKILRQSEVYPFITLQPGLYMPMDAYEIFRLSAYESSVYQDQLLSNTSVLGDTLNFDKASALRNLGYGELPTKYILTPKNEQSKDQILNYLHAYNTHTIDKVEPLDKVGMALSIANSSVDLLSLIINIFTLISIFTSMIMIFIMTYQKISEKSKTFGILKSFGANNPSLYKIVSFELLLVSLLAFSISILCIMITTPIINRSFNAIIPSITLITVTPLSIFIILAVTLLLAFTFGLMPLYVLTKKNVITYIKSIN